MLYHFTWILVFYLLLILLEKLFYEHSNIIIFIWKYILLHLNKVSYACRHWIACSADVPLSIHSFIAMCTKFTKFVVLKLASKFLLWIHMRSAYFLRGLLILLWGVVFRNGKCFSFIVHSTRSPLGQFVAMCYCCTIVVK